MRTLKAGVWVAQLALSAYRQLSAMREAPNATAQSGHVLGTVRLPSAEAIQMSAITVLNEAHLRSGKNILRDHFEIWRRPVC